MPGKAEDGYRILAESGQYVLADRDEGEHGLHFVTREYSPDRKSVGTGHYTTNFEEAKRSFALRSGMVDSKELINQADLQALCRQLWNLHPACVDSAYQNELESIIQKLEDTAPALKDCRPELYIYRNTLFYRLGKIRDLFIVDLSNGYERLKILLSLKLLQLMKA